MFIVKKRKEKVYLCVWMSLNEKMGNISKVFFIIWRRKIVLPFSIRARSYEAVLFIIVEQVKGECIESLDHKSVASFLHMICCFFVPL